MNSKPWFKSKTIWVNAGTVLALVLTYALDAQDVLPEGVIPDQVYSYAAWALGLVNIGLRYATKQPVEGPIRVR